MKYLFIVKLRYKIIRVSIVSVLLFLLYGVQNIKLNKKLKFNSLFRTYIINL